MIPTLGSIDVGADLRVEIPVEDLGGAASVRVDYAVAAAEPAESSYLWRNAGSVASPASVFTPVQLLGSIVWIRASGRTSAGVQTSAYTVPLYVEVVDQARFVSITFELDDRRVPVVRWDPSALCAGVRISWATHPAEYDAGSWEDTADIEAVYGEFTLPVSLEIDEAVTIEVEAWDTWESDIVAGTLGDTVSQTLVRTAMTLELDWLVLRSPDGAHWKVSVSNSGELVVEEISV
jgi:hypothetical protein